MACTWPLDFATQTGSPSRSTCSADSSASSVNLQAGWKAMVSAPPLQSGPRSQPHPCQLVLDRGRNPLAHVLEGDLGDDFREEPADDQSARLVGRDAAGHQVEQRLVVEATGRAGVAGAGDLAGLDLEVGHRV